MPAPTPNPRGAEFWNSAMGHSWVSQQAVISDVFTSVTSVSLDAAAAMLKLSRQINQSENVTHNECKRGSLQ